MGDELVRYGGMGSSRIERKAAKEIAVARARSAVACARDVAKVEAVAEVAERAMLANAEVTMLEQALAAQNPAVAARVKAVADAGCAATVGIVFRTGGRS